MRDEALALARPRPARPRGRRRRRRDRASRRRGSSQRGVAPERVTMIDQSPHQLARARRKRALDAVAKRIGDAEDLPLATDSVDRYVSAGSIEYWPDPQRAIAEAYRVVRPGGVALVVGPLRRTHPLARRLSDAWMLFPADDEYAAWMEAAGFTELRRVAVAPPWWRAEWDDYGVAIAGVEAGGGPVAARRRGRRDPRARRPTSASARRGSRASLSARSRARRSSPSHCGSRCASGSPGAAQRRVATYGARPRRLRRMPRRCTTPRERSSRSSAADETEARPAPRSRTAPASGATSRPRRSCPFAARADVAAAVRHLTRPTCQLASRGCWRRAPPTSTC